MIKHLAGSLLVGLALFACAGGTGSVGQQQSRTVQEQGELTSSSGLTVTATIASVTLGDDCGGARAPSAGLADCAPSEDGTGCGGGGFCQQSNVQLAFATSDGAGAASVTVLRVTLHDADDGAELTELDAASPRAWDDGGYVAWDGRLAPSSELKASYDLSAPEWSTISKGDEWSTYSQKFRLRITIQVDGAALTIESGILNREPAVAT